MLTDAYRHLPMRTDSCRCLPVPTDAYRCLPMAPILTQDMPRFSHKCCPDSHTVYTAERKAQKLSDINKSLKCCVWKQIVDMFSNMMWHHKLSEMWTENRMARKRWAMVKTCCKRKLICLRPWRVFAINYLRRCGCTMHAAYRCLPMPTHAFRCLPMLADAYRFIPLPTDAYRCIPMLTDVHKSTQWNVNVFPDDTNDVLSQMLQCNIWFTVQAH